MFNVRTIVKKVISTGAISILVEYVNGTLSSYFTIPTTASTINDVPLTEGHLVFVNNGNPIADFYIDENGNLKLIADSSEVDKYSVNADGHLIYTN